MNCSNSICSSSPDGIITRDFLWKIEWKIKKNRGK
jgi:hypothetical protein